MRSRRTRERGLARSQYDCAFSSTCSLERPPRRVTCTKMRQTTEVLAELVHVYSTVDRPNSSDCTKARSISGALGRPRTHELNSARTLDSSPRFNQYGSMFACGVQDGRHHLLHAKTINKRRFAGPF